MRNEPNWLTAEHLVELNEQVVASTGEPHGILKPHELESAPYRVRALWHYENEDNLAVLAVRLLIAVAVGHPFEQGNKRTGFIAATIFLGANGWYLDVEDHISVAELIEAAVEDRDREYELVELFESRMIEMA